MTLGPIWSTPLRPGSNPIRLDRPVKINSVVLHSELTDDATPSRILFCYETDDGVSKTDPLLTLTPNQREQTHLSLVLYPGKEYSLSLTGSNLVYLVGHYAGSATETLPAEASNQEANEPSSIGRPTNDLPPIATIAQSGSDDGQAQAQHANTDGKILGIWPNEYYEPDPQDCDEDCDAEHDVDDELDRDSDESTSLDLEPDEESLAGRMSVDPSNTSENYDPQEPTQIWQAKAVKAESSSESVAMT
ncbi:hypothetical protein EV715DRAFT_297535 [Schizophyllum commune]